MIVNVGDGCRYIDAPLHVLDNFHYVSDCRALCICIAAYLSDDASHDWRLEDVSTLVGYIC